MLFKNIVYNIHTLDGLVSNGNGKIKVTKSITCKHFNNSRNAQDNKTNGQFKKKKKCNYISEKLCFCMKWVLLFSMWVVVGKGSDVL